MARRGRKRRRGAAREPNGRISRKARDWAARGNRRLETQARIMETAISVRVRAGVPRDMARSLGTPEAFLHAAGRLSRDQYEAACYYLECLMRYRIAIDEPHAPREPREAGSGSGGSGGFGDEAAHERFCAAWIGRFEAIREAVQDAQNRIGTGGNLWGALDALERGSIEEHQVKDLGTALDAVDGVRRRAKNGGDEP